MTAGVVGPEPSIGDKGRHGAAEIAALHDELDSLMRQLEQARSAARDKDALQLELEQAKAAASIA